MMAIGTSRGISKQWSKCIGEKKKSTRNGWVNYDENKMNYDIRLLVEIKIRSEINITINKNIKSGIYILKNTW